MKRHILYLLLSASIITTISEPITAQINSLSAQSGWDIYKAGVYRYGPSFITYEDGSIDAWFAAPGQGYDDCVLYQESTCTPRQLGSGFVAQYFKTDVPIVGFSFLSPTWAHNGTESMRLTIFKWDATFANTRKGTPLAQNTVSGYNDNAVLSVKVAEGEMLPPGEYLVQLDQASTYAGVWYYEESNHLLTTHTYLGTAVKKTGSLRGFVLFDHKCITEYWDQASYQHSEDGGRTWTPEIMTLKPTRGTRDQYSICDPSVVYFGDYYYAGYTSTEHAGGLENHLFVARSPYPDGPWEKWDGSGWSEDAAEPIIEYDRVGKGGWGLGEPSLVVKDDQLYIYYTYDTATPTTHLATARIDDENWPLTIQLQGKVITKVAGSDHCDVKYVDAAKRFIAVNTAKRMSKDAYIEVWQSANGTDFEHVGTIEGILSPSGCHNCGLNGDEQGHIDVNKPQHIAFAYGLDANGNSAWASWSTYLQPITINYTETSGIESVTTDDRPAQLYNLQGIEVNEQSAAHGLYIKRQGDSITKVLR